MRNIAVPNGLIQKKVLWGSRFAKSNAFFLIINKWFIEKVGWKILISNSFAEPSFTIEIVGSISSTQSIESSKVSFNLNVMTNWTWLLQTLNFKAIGWCVLSRTVLWNFVRPTKWRNYGNKQPVNRPPITVWRVDKLAVHNGIGRIIAVFECRSARRDV